MSNFYFPEDLLLDVLSRLPVKTLLCFRGVSKSWCHLISSRSLAKMYLNRMTNRIVVRGHGGETSKLYAMDCSTSAVKELHYPPLKYKKNSGVELLGSSNGVLCLHYAYRRIVVWNPLSQKYRELSRPRISCPSSLPSRNCCAYGFGYDKTTDDYKIVAMVNFCDKDGSVVSYDGRTYSLKSKRWKRIENFSYALRYWQTGILVGGALHWITRDGSLLAFDLADEKFRMVPQPTYSSNIYGLTVGILGDCLSLTCQSRTNYAFEMWLMKDYGIKESWTRINLDLLHVQGCYPLRPIAYQKSNRHVIIQDGTHKLLLYDFEKQSVQNIAVDLSLQAYPYLETLECYDGTSNETARKSCKHKRTRRAERDDASTFMDRKSKHHWKRIKL